MPYYIEQNHPECKSGWAVVDSDNAIFGCHSDKQSAIDQAIAISLSDEEPFEGERKADGDPVIICDIDGTLLNGSTLIQKTWDFVRSLEGALFIVTGRPESERDSTISDLRDAGVTYSRLIMNPGSTANSVAYKKATAEKLLETYNVVAAIENNSDALRAYSSLGIEAINPRDISEGRSIRAALDELMIGDWVSWDVLNPEIAAVIVDIQQDQALLGLYDYEDGIFEQTDKVMILNIFRLVKIARPEMVAEEIPHQDEIPQPEGPIEPAVFEMATRAIDQEAPAYMRAAARRGLEYYADGLGGDGLVEATIREARDMAEGRVSDDKWIRIAAWIARHLGDLDSPDANPESDNYPSAGVVAHLLWGSGPSKASARRALDYAESVVARIRTEQESERMTEPVIDESRDKWLRAAWKIKARLEGNAEGRSLGGIETRANHVELRAEGDGRTFSGYASVFNEPSLPLPFTEIVKPGAFKRSLQSRNRMMLLWNHDTSNPLASTRNGSLVLTEDAKGLFVTATLPDTTLGRDIAELVRTGVVDAMSFGFSVRKDSWSHDGSTRYLEDVSLSEVSLVSTPAYEQTSGTVSVRSADGISADALADALLKIESGDELDSEQGALMRDVIERLSKTEATPEPEVEGDLTALYKKKLALAEMGN